MVEPEVFHITLQMKCAECCVQEVKAERDSLQEEVTKLQRKLKDCGLNESYALTTLDNTMKPRLWSCLKHGLQLAILLGYFCYEDYSYVCKKQ